MVRCVNSFAFNFGGGMKETGTAGRALGVMMLGLGRLGCGVVW